MTKRILAVIMALAMLIYGYAGAFASEAEVEEGALLEEEQLLEDPSASAVEDWMSDTAEQEIVIDQLLTVEDYAVTEGLPDNWFNILLLGTDVRDTKNYGRTDSMIVLSVNLATKEAKLTSFMRDLWVPMHGRSSKGKLNAACVYGGPELTMRTINENFGLNLKYYALVNLSCMADIIDQLGGIHLDVTEAEKKALNKGLFDLSSMSGMEKLQEHGDQVLLNGNQAVAFARIRQIDSDYKRTERQRTVLMTIAKRLQNENPGTLVGIVTNMLKYVETNMNLEQLMTLAYVGMQMDMDNIGQFRIPADNTFKSGTFDGVWCIKANFDKNKALLKEFIYG